jgi:hypothetical protein
MALALLFVHSSFELKRISLKTPTKYFNFGLFTGKPQATARAFVEKLTPSARR